MGDITFSLTQLLWILTFIAAVGLAITYLKKGLSPFTNLKQKVTKHAEYLDNDNRRIDDLEKAAREASEDNKILCKSMLCLMEHAITNNSIDKLKDMKKELQEHLISR